MPVLRGALATGGQLPNFLGVLAGSPAALRAYARFRSELRHGKLTLATLERIALAVAEYYHSEPGIAMHSRTARAAGLAIDEVALARQFTSNDPREAALLRYLQVLLEERGRRPCTSTRRPGKPGGTTSRSSRRSRRWRSRPLRRWSTSPARCRSTARAKRRALAGGVSSGIRWAPASTWTRPERAQRSGCCPLYHEAVELVGRRWTGAILRVLMDGPLRFSEVAQAVPELSDRLLSERMKELEARGIVERHRDPGPAAARRVRALADGPRARAGALRSSSSGPSAGSRRGRRAQLSVAERTRPASDHVGEATRRGERAGRDPGAAVEQLAAAVVEPVDLEHPRAVTDDRVRHTDPRGRAVRLHHERGHGLERLGPSHSGDRGRCVQDLAVGQPPDHDLGAARVDPM